MEPSYAYKLFYSIYNHQVEKSKKYIERIKREILIMENYESKDRDNIQIITEAIRNEEPIEITKKDTMRQQRN